MDVRIIYEDQEIIVVIKPAGMPSQSDRGMTMDMGSYLKNYLAPSVSGEPYIGVIHRLDRPVGGVMVYAKTPQAAKILSGQLQKKQIGKVYHHPLYISCQRHLREPMRAAFRHADCTVDQRGQKLPRTDPLPVEAVLRFCGRFRRIPDNGRRVAGKHQPGGIQRHGSGKYIKIGCHGKSV